VKEVQAQAKAMAAGETVARVSATRPEERAKVVAKEAPHNLLLRERCSQGLAMDAESQVI
jgi:hypothetical protein